MSVTRIDIDDDALNRAMTLSGAKTKTEAVNLAPRFYAEEQEHGARIARHFDRAQHWDAIEDAERLHQAEKQVRRRSGLPISPIYDRASVTWRCAAQDLGSATAVTEVRQDPEIILSNNQRRARRQ